MLLPNLGSVSSVAQFMRNQLSGCLSCIYLSNYESQDWLSENLAESLVPVILTAYFPQLFEVKKFGHDF